LNFPVFLPISRAALQKGFFVENPLRGGEKFLSIFGLFNCFDKLFTVPEALNEIVPTARTDLVEKTPHLP